ncbi:alpha/beta hydrolase [Streptomyces sp. SL13]|uniref:Alpha/beta hydrolase n=1 Tax=Streptantibioticus silvisoli TaxID=2705255 RepID=A0AA90JYF2_9ACTN|nr:alpha/beta hydrolase [Streptantibioticus silvisoli]MDI5967206.1 alpha/beta hydrolase [Streptantibioticus silvisoli]MDI5971186.1 alpha/beta hydrolase [Streptantibioticus silvisoli]
MGSYVMAGGLRTYYEQWGSAGEPVILLHGGGVTADTWQAQGPALAARYRVLAPERRGHGRTPDVAGPVSYAAMADDTAAFAEALDLGPARVVGWSDGAAVGLHLALRRPDLVGRLVVIGAAITRDGDTPAARALIDDPAGHDMLAGWFRPLYAPLSPDGPDHFDTVFAKLLAMWAGGSGLTMADLAAITAPTLVMQGDDDGVRPAHSAEMAAALPDAQLAVVPGTSHALPVEKPDLVNGLLMDFLAERQPPKLLGMSGETITSGW